MNQLFRSFLSKKAVSRFREIVEFLAEKAGLTEEVPAKVERNPVVPTVVVLALAIILEQFGWFSIGIPALFMGLCVFLVLFLDQLWIQKDLKRELKNLVTFAEQVVARLREEGRTELAEDIEDVEVLIADYKDRFGF